MSGILKKTALFAAIVSMFVFPALAQRTNLTPAWNLFTPQQDIEMGRELAGDAELNLRLVDQPNANAYIDALGKQLTAHAPGAKYPYQFKIVSDDAVNAWALPGGFIYVTSGLIQTAQNEPQMAGYLAHQIAHIALRHGTAEVSQAYSQGAPNAARRRVSVSDAMSALNIRFEPNSIPLKFTREEERQAHITATQILWDARFDPALMTRAFEANRSSEFFTAHPYLPNHSAIARTELRNLGGLPPNLRGDSPDLHSVKDRLAANNNWPSVSDRNRRRGDRPDQPSTRMVWYRGRDVEFRHPDNWSVTEDGDAISIAPDGGFVSGAMAYGITIATFDPQQRNWRRNSFQAPGARTADTVTLSGATDALIAHLRESNPNMRVVRDTGRRRVGGAQAMVVELTNDSPLGGNERNWLVTVLRPDGLLRYFIGVTPQSEFSRYQPVFDQIVTSVRLLD